MSHLRRIVLHQQTRLLLGNHGVQRMKDAGAHRVRLPLEDLVAQDEMVPELGRQQLRQQAVILMSIVTLRSEDDLRIARLPEIAQLILDDIPARRGSSVAKIEDGQLDVGFGAEGGECLPLLAFALGAASG